ncbi:hypothetical protein RJ640_023232 [Escallonia rubra]|uniref:STI1 domain-containing protein n=1 Tax=Escallonia rubra TaxID=112253 RepID=A0AA88QPI2_9ASTE|nr:hypothetical protein RJ640_023232 [Escallonia rubra]
MDHEMRQTHTLRGPQPNKAETHFSVDNLSVGGPFWMSPEDFHINIKQRGCPTAAFGAVKAYIYMARGFGSLNPFGSNSVDYFSKADAEKTVELKPYWPKGYSRLGAAQIGLHNYHDAVFAYKKGLEFDPNNEALKSGLSDAQSAMNRARPPPMSSSNPFGDAFGPEMWAKLTADPATRIYLQQPDFVRMMQDLQKNPSNLNLYLKDQRVMQSLGYC